MFGDAAVCSNLLIELHLDSCGLWGNIPELHLPAARIIYMSDNELTGTLAPLSGCLVLEELGLDGNHLTGTLQPLDGFERIRVLNLTENRLTGGLEPLRGFAGQLQGLDLASNELTGDLEALRGCTALQVGEARW